MQAALRFLDAVRSDHRMRLELEGLGPEVSEDDLVGLAHDAGFDIGLDQLRRAHALDWRMRQARFTVWPRPSESSRQV